MICPATCSSQTLPDSSLEASAQKTNSSASLSDDVNHSSLKSMREQGIFLSSSANSSDTVQQVSKPHIGAMLPRVIVFSPGAPIMHLKINGKIESIGFGKTWNGKIAPALYPSGIRLLSDDLSSMPSVDEPQSLKSSDSETSEISTPKFHEE